LLIARPQPTACNPHNERMTGPQDSNDAFNFQRELDRMEELFIDSPHFFKRAIVHEEDFFDQLDMVRENLPQAFRQAEEIIRQRDQMLEEAERYAEKVVEDAQNRANLLLAENVIVRQAEFEAQQIRTQLNSECNAAQDKTIAEIEQARRQAQADLEEMRHRSLLDAEDIQRGADEYADKVLRDMEAQMADMLRVVRNGRQQLKINQPDPQAAYRNMNGSGAPLSGGTIGGPIPRANPRRN
jgi:F0F1-type ATP synthase membrane subunit b/b'